MQTQLFTNESPVFVCFNSHRARQKASKILTLPKPFFNFEKSGHFYPLSKSDAEKLDGIKGVKQTNSLPKSSCDWHECWH